MEPVVYTYIYFILTLITYRIRNGKDILPMLNTEGQIHRLKSTLQGYTATRSSARVQRQV